MRSSLGPTHNINDQRVSSTYGSCPGSQLHSNCKSQNEVEAPLDETSLALTKSVWPSIHLFIP